MILKGSQMKTRKFEYQPRHYDPKQEERDQKKALLNDKSLDGSKNRISNSFKRSKKQNKFLSGQAAKSNKRLMIIVVGLAFLTYLFMIYLFPSILKAL